jgi:CRISPR-associated protein Cas1
MHLHIQSFGAHTSVSNGMFVIRHKKEQERISPRHIDSISFGRGILFSSDVLYLAMHHQIPISFGKRSGYPAGRVWSEKYGGSTEVRRKQSLFFETSKANRWVIDVIVTRLEGQVENLLEIQKLDKSARSTIQRATTTIKTIHTKLRNLKTDSLELESVRGLEGAASKAYFETIGKLLPPDFRFHKRSRQPATDAFNCLLNYSLGILYGHVEMALIRAGLDPYIGLLHGMAHNQLTLVFDTIELYRHWAERASITFAFMQKQVNMSYFDIDKQQGFWLNKEGKAVFIPHFDDFFSQKIRRGLKKRSRYTQIDLEAHDLARFILKAV